MIDSSAEIRILWVSHAASSRLRRTGVTSPFDLRRDKTTEQVAIADLVPSAALPAVASN
jgi:hypothetical protein